MGGIFVLRAWELRGVMSGILGECLGLDLPGVVESVVTLTLASEDFEKERIYDRLSEEDKVGLREKEKSDLILERRNLRLQRQAWAESMMAFPWESGSIDVENEVWNDVD